MSCQNTQNKECFFFLNCSNLEFRLNGSVSKSCAIYTESVRINFPTYSLLASHFHLSCKLTSSWLSIILKNLSDISVTALTVKL